MRIKGSESSQRGAAVLEATLTMLTLLILIFAIFEAARILNIQQTLANAAREGARFSVLPAAASGTPPLPSDTLPTAAAVQTRVQNYLNAAGLNGATAQIDVFQCCDPTTANCTTSSTATGTATVPTCPSGQFHYSRVKVTVPYNVLSVSMFGALQMNLRGQATMRNETNLQ
jgi:Flp pilus assembly protein TadG